MGPIPSQPGDAQDIARLLERVRAGDDNAASKVIEAFEDSVRRAVQAILPQQLWKEHSEDDIIQDTFADFFASLTDKDHFESRSELADFLVHVARDKVANLVRFHTETPKPTVSTGADSLPTSEELATLPRWAIVAFAARCARRVLPMFKHVLAEAPQKQVQDLDQAVTAAEQAAAEAGGDGVLNATAGDQALTISLSTPSPVAASIATAAFNASHAVNYARLGPRQGVVDAGISAAIVAVTITSVSGNAVRIDFDRLRKAAAQEKWTDDTPVPPSFFGPLWPEGPPPRWPAQEEPSEGKELVLQIEVPEDATEEQVREVIRQLVGHADDYDRANGGHGLKVSSIEITEDAALVPEGVR